jgi:hypothetical protein
VRKENGAVRGFNRWTLNGEAFSMETMKPAYFGFMALFNYA